LLHEAWNIFNCENFDTTAFQIVSFLKRKFKKVDQGTEKCVTAVDSVDIYNVIWKDNKTVILLSTLAGKIPMHQVERYDRTRYELLWTALRL
jgi:hypothetical protein